MSPSDSRSGPGTAAALTPGAPRAAAALLVTAFAAVLAAGCGGSAGGGHVRAAEPGRRASAPAAGAFPVRATAADPVPDSSATPSATPSPDPGLLPQTTASPVADDPGFEASTQALWQAITQDDPALAQRFFFPLSAYLQVKAINDPAEDYRDRLLAWYSLDIKAAHDLLGADAPNARLVRVDVPADQAEWIPPGVEYNKGPYYRVYGTRLIYQEDGRTASFGIFSLISWRGEWYVVHLGPSVRSELRGIVYEPMG